jgi:hypothetical protein
MAGQTNSANVAPTASPPDDPILKLAWQRFALYDTSAIKRQRSFFRLQIVILCLGVLGTLLALLQTTLLLMNVTTPEAPLNAWLRIVIILTPILVSILMAGAVRFNAGGRWVLLRGSAETIKRAIYRYRTGTGNFRRVDARDAAGEKSPSPQSELAAVLQSVSSNLMQTNVNLSALGAYEEKIPPKNAVASTDDGMTPLNAERYLADRLSHQVGYFQIKTGKLEKQLVRYQWLILIIGGAGTFLAAVGLELWIALTTALVAAFAAYLDYHQTEKTLMIYNQALTGLQNVQAWWIALSEEEKADPAIFDQLVDDTEHILATEHAGWVQQLEDAMERLRQQQTQELDRVRPRSVSPEQDGRAPENGAPLVSIREVQENPPPAERPA